MANGNELENRSASNRMDTSENTGQADNTTLTDWTGQVGNASRKTLKRYMQALSSVCFSGVTAYYFAINGVSRRHEQRKILEQWGIQDAKTMKEQLNWLLEEGRRAQYNKIRNYLTTLSEAERQIYIASLPENSELTVETQVVNHFLRRLPEAGIAAVDYAWCAYLCQGGNRIGHLQYDEYTEYMLRLAQQAQHSYTGWDAYIIAFAAGVQFVDHQAATTYVNRSKELFNKLLYSRYSPMRRIDWNAQFLETS